MSMAISSLKRYGANISTHTKNWRPQILLLNKLDTERETTEVKYPQLLSKYFQAHIPSFSEDIWFWSESVPNFSIFFDPGPVLEPDRIARSRSWTIGFGPWIPTLEFPLRFDRIKGFTLKRLE